MSNYTKNRRGLSRTQSALVNHMDLNSLLTGPSRCWEGPNGALGLKQAVCLDVGWGIVIQWCLGHVPWWSASNICSACTSRSSEWFPHSWVPNVVPVGTGPVISQSVPCICVGALSWRDIVGYSFPLKTPLTQELVQGPSCKNVALWRKRATYISYYSDNAEIITIDDLIVLSHCIFLHL